MKVVIIPILVAALLGCAFAEKNYTDFVLNLNDSIHNQKLPFYHSAWERLAYITDTYGTRMWGTDTLEQVIREMAKQATDEKFENIKLEPVKNFTKWVRGKESLTMTSPRPVSTPLKVIGLGGSVAGNVSSEVIVFKNWDEMEQRKSEVSGKIVVFNNVWVDYFTSVDYRVNGASRAAQDGAIAMLVRSVTPTSIESVHTGYMEYDPKQPKIPCAAISTEDADMFQRMQDRGQKIVVRLSLENQFVPGCTSNNLVFEIKGSTYPEQIILAGGHIDSWDTGSQTGANDDGGGFITVFEALRLLNRLQFRPKRTLRFIAWSGEESGSEVDGAAQYASLHKDELKNHIAAFESDLGSTRLMGFGHTGAGQSIVKNILTNYLSLLGSGDYSDNGYSADVEPLYEGAGVPILNNIVKDTADHEFYFRYHHSAGDSMSMMDPDDMDSNVVGIAAMLYIIADLDVSLRSPTQYQLQRE